MRRFEVPYATDLRAQYRGCVVVFDSGRYQLMKAQDDEGRCLSLVRVRVAAPEVESVPVYVFEFEEPVSRDRFVREATDLLVRHSRGEEGDDGSGVGAVPPRDVPPIAPGAVRSVLEAMDLPRDP